MAVSLASKNSCQASLKAVICPGRAILQTRSAQCLCSSSLRRGKTEETSCILQKLANSPMESSRTCCSMSHTSNLNILVTSHSLCDYKPALSLLCQDEGFCLTTQFARNFPSGGPVFQKYIVQPGHFCQYTGFTWCDEANIDQCLVRKDQRLGFYVCLILEGNLCHYGEVSLLLESRYKFLANNCIVNLGSFSSVHRERQSGARRLPRLMKPT